MLLRSLPREAKCWISGDSLRSGLRFASTTSGGGRLNGKVALITGGASGLGRAAASQFIQHGAQVIIADIDSLKGPQVAEILGPQAQFIPCDVSVEAQVSQAVDATVANHGKLDIMFNNAGIAGKSIPPGIADLDLGEFDRVMGVNVRGAMAGIKHAARVMIPVGSGSILCTASISGILGGLGPHPYSISKFTIPGIVKAMSHELSQHGIRINCISPFPIPTPLVVSQLSAFYTGAAEEEIAEMVNGLGELKGTKCEESDIAHAALYLASDEAKYVTGHNLVVDGGFTCSKTLRFPSPGQAA